MYNNRDISWLGFNNQVLKEADNSSIPLMERINFLSIFSSNLDEFFKVRFPVISAYANLTDKLRNKINPPPNKNLLEDVQTIVDEQLEAFGKILNEKVIPGLQDNKIILYYNKIIPEQFITALEDYFFSRVLSFIQPIFIQKTLSEDFFPESNKQYFLVSLTNDANNIYTHAFINIPSEKLGRFHTIDSEDGAQHIFFIDDIIRQNLSYIFSGYQVNSCFSFKITRDADLNLNEENVKADIIDEIEKKILHRVYAKPSRLLFEKGIPLALQKLLGDSFNLSDSQIFNGGRYHNLSDLNSLPIQNKNLRYLKFYPQKHHHLHSFTNLFHQIETKDILLHFPYHSYNPVLSFFNQAAIDPDVKSIYVTLYRIAADSHIANALMSAAKNKKEVIVFVELMARFDEANNILWSKAMKRAGVKIVYSIPGIKVHSKIALVKNKNGSVEKKYAYIGTGNFNETTARFYTDHALLTTNKDITNDLEILFASLSKKIKPEKKLGKKFHRLLVSQNNLVEEFEKEINNQIHRCKKGLNASIKIKLNNLEDIGMINLLYKASQAGVTIQLIVRSICCLQPGITAISNNIRVKRIVDRFLEHSRIFIFESDNNNKVFIGSSDWMSRNLYKRIEVVTPILDTSLAKELEDYFDIQWQDEYKAIELSENLQPIINGTYTDNIQTAQQKIHALLSNKL